MRWWRMSRALRVAAECRSGPCLEQEFSLGAAFGRGGDLEESRGGMLERVGLAWKEDAARSIGGCLAALLSGGSDSFS
eukprot:4041581-Pleurochrysis_carterae.AAC.2